MLGCVYSKRQIDVSMPHLSYCLTCTCSTFVGNKLRGSIPAEMWDLSSVQKVVLALNSINGTIPTAIANLSSSLTEL